MELAPGTTIGKYVVSRKIAEGGMAEIYLASLKGPHGFEREVCIKRIREFLSKDPHFRDMFIAEARIVGKLSHPNIVQVFDFDQTWDTYYIAMEYVQGRSLADIRNRGREKMKRVAPLLALDIAHEVAKGLAHAHRLRSDLAPTGVVHRDVTPHNILVSYFGDVKLTDFGIAKIGGRLSTSGSIKGKFSYMSPEQARGDEVDVRTDVFALGIVLWEMLTGARLFDGDSDTKVIKAVQESEVAPPNRLNPDVPKDLSDLVMRALQRPREKRFADGHEMALAMRSVLFAHGEDSAGLDLSQYMTDLFGDPSEHTNIVRRPSRRFGGDELSSSRPKTADLAKKNPDDDPLAPTHVRVGSKTGPPPLDEPVRRGESTVSARPANVANPGSVSVSVDFTENQPPQRRGRAVAAAGIAVFVVGAGLLAYQRTQARGLSVGGEATTAQAPASSPALEPVVKIEPAPTPPAAPAAASAHGVEVAESPKPEPATALKASEPATPARTEKPASRPPRSTERKPPLASKTPAVEPAAKGVLQVIVSPWAHIFIDDKDMGTAPGEFNLAAGRHIVHLVNADAKIDRSEPVVVVQDQLNVLRIPGNNSSH